MLRELTVQNFALIKELHIELAEGLTVLTGATGAGKSIVVGAIGLLLGAKAGVHMIRREAPSATVEGVFDLSSRKGLINRLQQMGLEIDEDLLILKRQISTRTENRAYVNGSRVTMVQLKQIGDMLVDLHGQHDHQSLLRPSQHLDLLDQYGQLDELRKEVANQYHSLQTLRRNLQELTDTIRQKAEHRELFEFQLQEIDHLNPKEGEDESLEEERRILENIELLFEGLGLAYGTLFEEENSVIERLSSVRQTLDRLAKTDSRLGPKAEECAAVIYQLEDLSSSLRQHLQSLQHDPGRLSDIIERLDNLARLKRKYGGSLAAALQRREELAKELETLASGDDRLQDVQAHIHQAEERFSQSCQRLSQERGRVAQRLQKGVEKQLEHLGMPKTRFKVQIEQARDEQGWVEVAQERYLADATGMDQVQFLISPNPGEGMRPLAKIASGGEISRIMLAMKSILANADQVPLLVFDEIDVGIGGQVAEAVGRALRELGQTHQVLCITHLHQIAFLGDHHFFVYKEQRRGRTETIIKDLSSPEREQEIARMMGGKEITPITLEHAREMMRQRDQTQAST